MKITATRIKEIIREEYRRMNEAEAPLKYRAGSPFTYTPVEKGSEEEQRAMDLAANTTGDYDLTVLGVRETSAGETEILVRKSDGEKDVVTIQKRQIKTDPDEDPEIERGRLNRPMGVKLEESRETLAQLDIMAKGPKGKITARQAKKEKLGNTLDDKTAAAAVRKDFGIDEEAEDAPKDTERVIDDIEDTSKFVDLPKEFTALISYIAKSVAPQVDNAIKAKYFEELARSLRKLDTAEEEIPT